MQVSKELDEKKITNILKGHVSYNVFRIFFLFHMLNPYNDTNNLCILKESDKKMSTLSRKREKKKKKKQQQKNNKQLGPFSVMFDGFSSFSKGVNPYNDTNNLCKFQKNQMHKRTMIFLYCSPEQTNLQITIEASANSTALRFLCKFYVQERYDGPIK